MLVASTCVDALLAARGGYEAERDYRRRSCQSASVPSQDRSLAAIGPDDTWYLLASRQIARPRITARY